MEIFHQRAKRRPTVTMHKKLIVILGPTASGKTDVSIKLAKKYKGEIISADSRQVYKDLNIGSGKITKKEMMGVPHYLLDVANPKRKFSVAQYQKLAQQTIKKIHQNNKIPFLVGGTGFYIQSVVDGIVLPEVKSNQKLRKQLEKKSAQALFLILKKLDPRRAKTIDAKNPRRLIRAIEIIKTTKQQILPIKNNQEFKALQIGIKKSPNELKKLLKKAQQKRFNQGMVTEVKRLHKNGLSWKRLEELGLEYRYVAQFLQNKITQKEMTEILEKEIWHFAKRQMTWFDKDKRIYWVTNIKDAEQKVDRFLRN